MANVVLNITVCEKNTSMAKLSIGTLLVLTLSISSISSPFTIPAVYQCTAVRLTQKKAGRIYTKGYQTPSFFIKITPLYLSAYGTHSEIRICRKIGIKRMYHDTLYLENPEEMSDRKNSGLKLYLVKDTIMGQTLLYDTDTSTIQLKAIVKKLVRYQESELEKLCR